MTYLITHPMLTLCYTDLCRHDLELLLTCYVSEDKQSSCNWPADVTIGINDHTLPIDRVRLLNILP